MESGSADTKAQRDGAFQPRKLVHIVNGNVDSSDERNTLADSARRTEFEGRLFLEACRFLVALRCISRTVGMGTDAREFAPLDD